MARPHEILILSEGDKASLTSLMNKGFLSARVLKRAEILLKSDQGYTVEEIAEMVDRHPQTVRNIRNKYIEAGLEFALEEKPRPGKPQKIFAEEEAIITTLACSEAPAGHSRWTLKLLADEVVQLTDLDSVHIETIRRVLKKVHSNPGRHNNGASVKSTVSI